MGVFKKFSPEDNRLELHDDTTIQHALTTLQLPVERVHAVLVNGTLERDLQRPLAEDDELTVLAPVGGG